MIARRLLPLAALFVTLAATGCGGSPAGDGGPSPPPAADPGAEPAAPALPSSPEDVARAYVDAINARDGETVCGLMLESAAYEFRIPDWGECPKFASAFIGYSDSGSGFRSARVLEIVEGVRAGELRSLRMLIEIEREGHSEARTLEDVLWLVHREGYWRAAKASGVLHAALGGGVAANVLEVPDLVAQQRAYEQAVAEERKRVEAADAGLEALEDRVSDCAGTRTSYDDADGDLHFEGDRELTREEAGVYRAADVRRVEVGTEGDDLCVRFTLGGSDIEERLSIRFDIYSPKKNPTNLGPQLKLNVDVRPDGRAQVVYQDLSKEEDDGRVPIVSIPSQIGREGETFSFRVARKDLLEVMGDRAGELPEWDGFLWGGITFYLVEIDGNRRAISDDVHHYLAMISHPGGKVFESGERQERDLPTG